MTKKSENGASDKKRRKNPVEEKLQGMTLAEARQVLDGVERLKKAWQAEAATNDDQEDDYEDEE